MSAPVLEIFSSAQGEGLLTGCRQLFIRLAGCNLHCAFCDTLVKSSDYCLIEKRPGARDYLKIPNPLKAYEVADIAAGFDLAGHHSFSVTGGEPLLHVQFIKDLAPLLTGLTRQGLYLETNGTLPEQLEQVVHLFDCVGMDIKLPSVSLMPPLWEVHRRFLAIAARRQVFVKVVVGEETTDSEIEQTADLIRECNKEITLIIQPVTPAGVVERTISPPKALHLQSLALSRLSNVLLIPQTHKIMGQL